MPAPTFKYSFSLSLRILILNVAISSGIVLFSVMSINNAVKVSLSISST
jgi:hypothetical protein